MSYTFTGKIHEVGDVEQVKGTGTIKEKCQFTCKDKKGEFLTFLIFNDAIYTYLQPLEIGDEVIIEFSIKSKKFTYTWTTNCYALTISKVVKEQKKQEKKSGYDDYKQYWQYRNFKQDTKSNETNYFAGITNKEDAKKKYRQLVKEYHPDKTQGDDTVIKIVNKQYERWR